MQFPMHSKISYRLFSFQNNPPVRRLFLSSQNMTKYDFVSGRLEGSEMMNENPSMQATKNETPPLTCAGWLVYPRFKLLLLLNIFLGPWLWWKSKLNLEAIQRYTIELWPQKSYKYFDCPWSWRLGGSQLWSGDNKRGKSSISDLVGSKNWIESVRLPG